MVRPDGSLTLIDYDGMFVSAMKGQKSPTIGTKDFSHTCEPSMILTKPLMTLLWQVSLCR